MFLRTESLTPKFCILQYTPHIELFERQNDGSWRFREVHGLEASLKVEAIGVTLSLGELYDRIEFP